MRVSYRKLNIKANARELASKVHADTVGACLVIGGCGNRYISLPTGGKRPADRYLQVRPQHDEYLKQETWVCTYPRVRKSYSQDTATVPQLTSRPVRSYVASGTLYRRRCVAADN